MATLDLNQISKSFGEAHVLHDIDLAIRDKEFVVFVGPSGCGKSTLLRIIAGLEEPIAGKIVINGTDVSAAHPVDRGIAMVFQFYALYPHLSVFENIAFPLRVQKIPQPELKDRVGRAAEILHLTDKLTLKPGQLSGGQRQRVAIGRSIVRNPKVFLFDEPLSNLDAALRGDMRVELSQLHRSLNATMVYVTHDQIEAMTMADRIVVLNAGRVEQFGTPLELYHHPATKFVASFIGQPNMNFVPATVIEADAGSLTANLAGDHVLTLPVDGSDVSVGDEIEVGIRPENVSLGGAGGLKMSVRVLERLGATSISYGEIAASGTRFCAALPGEAAVREGETFDLSVLPEDCHVFRSDGQVLRRHRAPRSLPEGKTMRVVTAGIGLRAGHVLSIMKETIPEMQMVGYFDPQPSHLEMIGEDTPRFDSVDAMLSDTRPDLFVVASPNSFHLEQIEAGLKAGVRIFAEKPVVISVDETMRLAELLAKHGTDRIMVGLVLRHSQHMIDLRHAIAEGVLGPITSIEANEHIAPYHGAFFMRDWRRESAHSGGFMLEKCCHDLDLYNMITASRPVRVASFGGRRSFLPEHAPTSNAEAEIFHRKKSVWNQIDDPFNSEGDIVDFQTAILQYETGASMAFHTNINVPDEHRRFCVMGARGMAEGDFMRGYLRITRRDGSRFADYDYTQGDLAAASGHYGADHMMVRDIADLMRGERDTLPVGIIDALQAGIAALALDQARQTGQVVDLADTWAEFDQKRAAA